MPLEILSQNRLYRKTSRPSSFAPPYNDTNALSPATMMSSFACPIWLNSLACWQNWKSLLILFTAKPFLVQTGERLHHNQGLHGWRVCCHIHPDQVTVKIALCTIFCSVVRISWALISGIPYVRPFLHGVVEGPASLCRLQSVQSLCAWQTRQLLARWGRRHHLLHDLQCIKLSLSIGCHWDSVWIASC